MIRRPSFATPKGFALLAALILALSSAATHAIECRAIPTVQQSADADDNTAFGGHLTQHILGMAPPPGTSQVGKTLFDSEGRWNSVWRQYQYIANPVACSGKQAQQRVSLSDLNIRYLDAFSCKSADRNGRCTSWDAYIAKSVFFGFILNAKGEWIINTAFPDPAP